MTTRTRSNTVVFRHPFLLKRVDCVAATPAPQDPRRQTLISNVLDDFQRLSRLDGGDVIK